MSDLPGQDAEADGADGEQDVVPDDDDEADAQAQAHAAAARKRRLDEVFGSGEHHGGGKGDAWYRDQTPPHHG